MQSRVELKCVFDGDGILMLDWLPFVSRKPSNVYSEVLVESVVIVSAKESL